jgi:hypothetical protein
MCVVTFSCCSCLHVCTGALCDGTHWSAILEVLSQKDAGWNGVLEPFFRGISITNTSTSVTEFWVTAFQNLFSLEKLHSVRACARTHTHTHTHTHIYIYIYIYRHTHTQIRAFSRSCFHFVLLYCLLLSSFSRWRRHVTSMCTESFCEK